MAATWDDAKEIRLLVNDPQGCVDIIAVASADVLPAAPAQQTYYYLQDTKRYVGTDLESGATAGDYETKKIRISDDRITALIDSLGADMARCRVLKLIMTKLGAELQVKSTSMGGDQSTYTSLKELYDYYEKQARECEREIATTADSGSSRVINTTAPEIAGGLL